MWMGRVFYVLTWLVAKDKFHVSYRGASLNSSLSQVTFQYFGLLFSLLNCLEESKITWQILSQYKLFGYLLIWEGNTYKFECKLIHTDIKLWIIFLIKAILEISARSPPPSKEKKMLIFLHGFLFFYKIKCLRNTFPWEDKLLLESRNHTRRPNPTISSP